MSRDQAAVARAISEHSESDAYDQVIVGYLLQMVQELRMASGPEAVQLNQRMGELVAAMDPDALARMLQMGGDSGQRHQFLINASQGLNGESILRLMQAASSRRENRFHIPCSSCWENSPSMLTDRLGYKDDTRWNRFKNRSPISLPVGSQKTLTPRVTP